MRKLTNNQQPMIKYANGLEFISQIKRDGSGTHPVNESYLKAMLENKLMKNHPFFLFCLSMTEKNIHSVLFQYVCGANKRVI
jgi:hypothetical protein